MIAAPKLAVGGTGRSNFRSTSPRPMMKAVPLPTIPVTANHASKSYYSSSENLTRSQSVEDEPIYDVPPCMANNWDSSQTLPRPSALPIRPQSPNLNSLSSACSSLSTINSVNSCTSVATLTAEGNGNIQRSPQSPSNNLLELSFSVEHYQRSPGSRQSEPPNIHSPASPHETRPPNSNSDRKRSKSKSRSLLHRSGSVLKSMFGGSSEDNHCTKPAKKVHETLSVEVSDYPSQMQGRLLLKEFTGLSFDEVTSEVLTANEMVPWQSVTIFTSHNQLCMQKNQSCVGLKEDLTFDLYAAKCSPLSSNSATQKRRSASGSDHKSAVFKLSLSSNDKMVRVFQTDTKDAMCQWVNCIQSISQSTPVYSQGSVSMSHSPMHDANLPALNRYQMSTSSYVPLIVTECCQRIEQFGLYTTGIYRVPGNTSHINSLLSQINPKQTSFDFNNADVHTIASLLKTFLRRLPEPLITHDWYSSLIVANRKRDRHERLQQMKMVIHQLPIHNFATLKYLMNHLDKIARESERNKMDFTNLATVFGPTLLRSPQSSSSKNSSQRDDMITVWGDMLEQRSIIEQIIANHQWLFASSMNSTDNVSQSSDNSLPDVVKDCGSVSSRDSGYPRRGSNVSLGSLTSIAQMHLSCTASAVRKMSVEKIANFGLNSVRLPKNNSPAKYSPNFAATKGNKSVSPSPIPRRSKSMSEKIEKNKKKTETLEVEKSSSSYASRGTPGMERFNSFSNASGVEGSDCGTFDQDTRPINGELATSNNKLLEDLDSLIESLKAEWKEKDEKVRRSAEEGQVMFDNFCKLFSEEEKKKSPEKKLKSNTTVESVETNTTRDVSGSKDSTPSDVTGDLEDIIAKELDAKIANLRLEYTFKVDNLPVVSLENEEKVVVEKAVICTADSNVPQKTESEFITNPSFSIKRQCGGGVLSDVETKVELRERPRTEGASPPPRQVSLYDNVDQSTTKDLLEDLSKYKTSESPKNLNPFPVEPKPSDESLQKTNVKAVAARINQKTQVGESSISDIRAKRCSDQTPLMKVDSGSSSICIQNPYVASDPLVVKSKSPSPRSNIGYTETVKTPASSNVGKHTRRGSNAGPMSPTTASWQISNCSGPQMSFASKGNQNTKSNVLVSNPKTPSPAVGPEKTNSGSSAAIDKTSNRSWVTRSNPDLLGGARSNRNTPGGKNSSSGHSTPAKQLMVFQSSQV